ncbi:hypothetical protein Vretifemale_17257 [Volvox reticuliferus]|uniref:Uncharacterized protein n=1 Tax=Volvox reticuliferus TaxID=1737510 RepID=A0A8J4CX96_9CHLO|nr:hypothetical protein Vretifemale_17257 [Volvox reticuliferus]
MSQSRNLELRCTGDVVSLDRLKQYIEDLLVRGDESLPERTCVQVASYSVPLCQEDVLAAIGRVDLRELYERLAKLVELRGRRRTFQSTNKLVHELLTCSNIALGACTSLMKMLAETGFREGDRDLDGEARREVDTLSSMLERIAGEYVATPLLFMAVLVEAGFSGTIAAMLQVCWAGGGTPLESR